MINKQLITIIIFCGIGFAIQLTDKKLQPLLKPSHYHPNGRNAYAHIALSIKEKFGKSYKDISDDKLDEVFIHIEYLLEKPN